MYYNGTITYKSVTSSTKGLIVTAPPLVTHSEIYGDVNTIPGRDGSVFGIDTYQGDAVIKVTFALVASSSTTSDFQTKMRAIRSWLTGRGKLSIGDTTDSFYEVKKVKIITDNRVILNYGTLEVEFTVYPYEFLTTGDTGVTSFPLTNNAMESKPLYKIVGTGSGTLTVNGHTMSYEVDGTLYIDTRRMIAYDANNANKNSKVSGDYEGLYLNSGSNTISASAGTLTVYPKWGFTV